MIRTLNWMALGIAIILAAALYVAKNDVKHAEVRLSTLQADIASAREAVLLLETEQAYLERPARLAHLAEARLGLVPVLASSLRGSADAYDELQNELRVAAIIATTAVPPTRAPEYTQ
ncbi:MAG: hypothetical protein JKX99_03750 [Robiginitomaculum sp.]|nr:hypothetical protein [Robiginitomaculum sp.]